MTKPDCESFFFAILVPLEALTRWHFCRRGRTSAKPCPHEPQPLALPPALPAIHIVLRPRSAEPSASRSISRRHSLAHSCRASCPCQASSGPLAGRAGEREPGVPPGVLLD